MSRLCWVLLLLRWRWNAASHVALMDATGKWQLQSLESTVAAPSIVTIVTSPGVPSLLLPMESAAEAQLYSREEEDPGTLVCRGATLGPLTSSTLSCLAFASLVSDVILLEGLTEGDVEGGMADTRHARTLSVLFQSRLTAQSPTRQTLLLAVATADADWDQEGNAVALRNQVRWLFDAVAASLGKKTTKKNCQLEDFYTLQVRSVRPSSAAQVRRGASCVTLLAALVLLTHLIIISHFPSALV
jgi:hypothetical protein